MSKVVIMAVSLRKDSFNKKLAKNVVRILESKPGHQYELLSFNDYPMPVYDGDVEAQGIPDAVKKLSDKIQKADAVIISTPEYNGGMPGGFKNAVDWLSRISPVSLAGKKLLLVGASPGALGAVRGLWHSRVPLEALGVHVYPEMFGLSAAHKAFNSEDQLQDAATEERIRILLNKFIDHV